MHAPPPFAGPNHGVIPCACTRMHRLTRARAQLCPNTYAGHGSQADLLLTPIARKGLQSTSVCTCSATAVDLDVFAADFGTTAALSAGTPLGVGADAAEFPFARREVEVAGAETAADDDDDDAESGLGASGECGQRCMQFLLK